MTATLLESRLQSLDTSEYKDYLLYSHDSLFSKENVASPNTLERSPILLAMGDDMPIPPRSPERLKKNHLASPDVRLDTSSLNYTLDYHSDDSSQISVFSEVHETRSELDDEDDEQTELLLQEFGYIYEQDPVSEKESLQWVQQVDERVVYIAHHTAHQPTR